MLPPIESLRGTGQSNSRQHKGIVVDNNDPEMKQRLKVRVPGILDMSKEELPWSLPFLNAHHGDSSSTASVDIPENGTEVVIEFLTDDTQVPYWTGRWGSNKVPSEFTVNYPNRYGEKDSNGTYWYFDKKTRDFKFKHTSGIEITIDSNANIVVKGINNINFEVARTWLAKVGDVAKFDTPLLYGTQEVRDKVRTMSGDRSIYNMHTHPGHHGPTAPPNQIK